MAGVYNLCHSCLAKDEIMASVVNMSLATTRLTGQGDAGGLDTAGDDGANNEGEGQVSSPSDVQVQIVAVACSGRRQARWESNHNIDSYDQRGRAMCKDRNTSPGRSCRPVLFGSFTMQ